jgi:hypothetical protein
MMGAAFQYYAEVTGEKVQAAQERVVARGVLPNSRISPGYLRGQDGVLVVERPKARIVQAFKRRDRGVSLVEIQALLAANGIQRSISGVAPIRTPASRAPRCRRHPAGRARRRRTRAMTARLRREGSTVLVAGRAITRPRAATPMTRSLAGTVSSASAALNGRPLPQILLIPAGLRARFPRKGGLDGSACRAPHARHRRARSGLRNAGHDESVAFIERHRPRVRRF